MNLFKLLCFLCLTLPSLAQSPNPTTKIPAPDAVTRISLGQSVVPLNGPWRFSIGDSPIDPATHQPLWAEPGFDDAHWETVDLTPKKGLFDPMYGQPGYVPGWTARGHRGYTGYAWYRLRVQVDTQVGQKPGAKPARLALAGPLDVDDGFQLFANGALVGSLGNFSGSRPVVYNSQPTFFSLPDGVGSENTQVLAFRVYFRDSADLIGPNDGGIHDAPLLGLAGVVNASYQLRWLQQGRVSVTIPFFTLLYILAAVIAFSLTLFDRADRVYWWIGAVFLLMSANNIFLLFFNFSQAISISAGLFWVGCISLPIVLATWVMVWWVWFRLRRPAWLPGLVAVFALLFGISEAAAYGLFHDYGLLTLSPAARHTFEALTVYARFGLLGALVLIVVLGVRQQGREGWVALPGVLLLGIARFQPELAFLHLPRHWFVHGIELQLNVLANLLLEAALFLLLLRRMLVSLRAQRAVAADLRQAVEVQQVLLPDATASYPGLTVESEYRPAQQVGGDFFQIIPRASDNSLLIVAGDVTGKGVQAGMLVALLVGAIRSTAEVNGDPLFILEALNRRLLGRKSAQATCLALRIASDGAVTLANAGHLPPYLNGAPVAMQGALPLGMIDDAEFSMMQFQLDPKDRLVLISDGVLEATDAKGKLFGFDKVQQLLQNKTPIAALARLAQQFGQQDDISLVAVTRA